MPLSKVRANLPEYPEPEPGTPVEGDLQTYEVFVQVERGKPHVHAGSINAPDDELALLYAREHYGRDQQCVQVWAVPRSAILSTHYDKDVVFRLSDQSYRFARGYEVGPKWRKLRAEKAVRDYEKDDLKEHF